MVVTTCPFPTGQVVLLHQDKLSRLIMTSCLLASPQVVLMPMSGGQGGQAENARRRGRVCVNLRQVFRAGRSRWCTTFGGRAFRAAWRRVASALRGRGRLDVRS